MANSQNRMSGCGAMMATGVLALGIMIFARAVSNVATSPPPPSQPAAPVESVSAQEILAAFDANELAAKRRFSGAIDVEGRVATITSVLGSPALELAGRTDFETITAVFGADANDALAAMSKGAEVRIRCGTVSDVITPQLENCILLSQVNAP